MRYHLMFDEIETEAIQAVRETIKLGLFKKDNSIELKKELIQKLYEKLCVIYELPATTIKYQDVVGVGNYNPTTNTITINKTSLVTLLHEFYHMKAELKNETNTEDKARGWSHSLYFRATPKLFEAAVRKGLLLFQNSMNDVVPVPSENEYEDEGEI